MGSIPMGVAMELLLPLLLILALSFCVGVYRSRALRAEAAIRKHRDQHADDRCWLDDAELYEALGEGPVAPLTFQVGDKATMLKNCERFLERRCFGGGYWRTYAELEAENTRLENSVDELELQVSLLECERIRLLRENGRSK